MKSYWASMSEHQVKSQNNAIVASSHGFAICKTNTMQINSSASTISLRFWFCRTGDLQNLIGCPIHYTRWHNHSSCTSDQQQKKLLISREETIDQQTFSLINLPNILSHGTNKQTNNWRRGQIWQKAKIIDKQSNKQEARLTERLTLQNLCAAFRHNRARRRGKGDEPGRLEFWNKNSFYITDYLFWLKEIAVVIMGNQGAWRSENNSFSTDY